ncbi:hypothetical protein [Microlunatus speluncae]|uniref:hypothetical protein n=1 Tax=Microlunatus speluncae TaxID=2594267 RepID=UPI001266336F|nr:hypothetical protein [Microlunatus speluncae]
MPSQPPRTTRWWPVTTIVAVVALAGLTLVLGPAILTAAGVALTVLGVARRKLRIPVRLALIAVGLTLAISTGLLLLDWSTGSVGFETGS